MEQEMEAQNVPSKQEQLAAVQGELQQSIASLESDFAKKCAELCESDPSLEELFFEDKEAFFKKILDYQNEVFSQEITPKQEAIANLQGDIALDEKLGALEAARAEFESANPNANTDELLAFFTTLPPEVQKELEALPPEQIFPALLELLQGDQEGEVGGELPKQISGAPANVSANEADTSLPTQRM